jgi:hypothetical protein
MNTTEANAAPRCQHILDNGRPCASPALRDSQFCYHHRRVHLAPPNPCLQPEAFIPLLETAESIRVAITNATRAVASGELTPQQANAIFRGLRVLETSMKRLDTRSEDCSPQATELNEAMSGLFNRAYNPMGIAIMENFEPRTSGTGNPAAGRATACAYSSTSSNSHLSQNKIASAPMVPTAAQLAHARSVIRRGPKHPEFAKCARLLDSQISNGRTA